VKLANFLLFQAVWFVAVGGAARGVLWAGPVAALGFLAVHLALVEGRNERWREARYACAVALIGALVDSLLYRFDVTAYPTSRATWTLPFVPPWIASLWLAFALLPRFSLAWLADRPAWASAFGAVGGPLSYWAGTRFGAVAAGESVALTFGALSLEYALVTPLLLRLAPGVGRSRR